MVHDCHCVAQLKVSPKDVETYPPVILRCRGVSWIFAKLSLYSDFILQVGGIRSASPEDDEMLAVFGGTRRCGRKISVTEHVETRVSYISDMGNKGSYTSC